MDSHFKIQRVKEEIQRLNIEIWRLVTHIKDEKEFLMKKEAELALVDPTLTFFVRRYRHQRGRFDEIHMKRLTNMVKKLGPSFTGTLVPGVRRAVVVETESINIDVAAVPAPQVQLAHHRAEGGSDSEDDWVDEDGDEDEDAGEIAQGEELSEVMEGVAMLSVDKDA